MEKRLIADDSSLLERAFAFASQKAQTLESLSSEIGVSVEDLSIYWVMVNKLRRSQGHILPVPLDTMLVNGERNLQYSSGSWYALTWRLDELLEQFQLNESLAVHYEHILIEPEGGHYELNLAASEIVLALQLENTTFDTAQMKRICVQACEPASGIELLVSNAGKMLLNIESYRDEPLTAAFIEHLYAKLTEGILIKEVSEKEEGSGFTAENLRYKMLESFCTHVWPEGCNDRDRNSLKADRGACGQNNHTIINALIALHFFRTFHLFPVGNSVFAYVMYFLILHRAGYHFSAHVPIVKLLYPQQTGAGGKCLACEPEDLSVECDGYYDWTRFFERALELVIDEQRWTMTKLDGMSRRRERFRTIIDADETLNYRQKEVLLEAILHSNAEFTYAIHVQRYDVSYPCARSDYARLLDLGFLRQHDDGIRHFFVASDNFIQAVLTYLRERCSGAFSQYYHEDGSLRDECKSTEAVAFEYNRDVGFYEKSLLDKTYIEHYDFRRSLIADHDGPRRHSHPKGDV